MIPQTNRPVVSNTGTDAVQRQKFVAAELETTEICFLLLDNFSLISFASAVEPLRITNKVLGRKVYRYRCLTADGHDVRASNGLMVRSDGELLEAAPFSLLAICSSDDIENVVLPAKMKSAIRKFVHQGCSVAGICTGAYVLAQLGLLDGRSCTIHWEYADAFRELFPSANLSGSLIETDGKIVTCAGGTAALDMMIGFIANTCGSQVGAKVAEIAMHHDVRTGAEHQSAIMRPDIGLANVKLQECVRIMGDNVAEPLALPEIATRTEISLRQLQRLFRQHFNETPLNRYMKIRLEAARQLVTKTSMPFVDVAVACGFVNASHFAKRYRLAFGARPHEDRQGGN